MIEESLHSSLHSLNPTLKLQALDNGHFVINRLDEKYLPSGNNRKE